MPDPSPNQVMAVKLTHVGKRFGARETEVLSDISLNVAPGEFLAVLGRVAASAGDRERFMGLTRADPAEGGAPRGLSTLAMRTSRSMTP